MYICVYSYLSVEKKWDGWERGDVSENDLYILWTAKTVYVVYIYQVCVDNYMFFLPAHQNVKIT